MRELDSFESSAGLLLCCYLDLSTLGIFNRSRVEPFFDRGDFVDSSLMSAALKLCTHPNLNDLVDKPLAEQIRREAEHIGIVVRS